jgi:Subtilase family
VALASCRGDDTNRIQALAGEESYELRPTAAGEVIRVTNPSGDIRNLTAEDIAAYSANKTEVDTVPTVTLAQTQEALLQDWERRGTEDIEVTFDLLSPIGDVDERGFMQELRDSGDDSARKQVAVRARHERFEPVRVGVRTEIARQGGLVRGAHWLTNQLVTTLKGSKIRAVSRAGGVVSWSENRRDIVNHGYNGDTVRNATMSVRFLNAGVRGACNTGACKKVAILEAMGSVGDPNPIGRDHYAFKRANGTSRISPIRSCGPTTLTCPFDTTPGPTTPTHATWIAGILAGSIEAGQDPNITNALARRERGGVAPEKAFAFTRWGGEFYSGGGCEAMNAGLQTAFYDGANVINASFGLGPTGNASTFDCAGTNATIRSLAANGIVVVASSGNAGDNTTNYPSVRPEVITVGGVSTEVQSTPYSSTVLDPNSSRSKVNITVNGVTYVGHYPVNIVAPSTVFLQADIQPGAYGGADITGTSISAPIVSGITTLLRDVYSNFAMKAWHVQSSILALGDGFEGPGFGGVSYRTGAGRIYARFPTAAGFGNAGWVWGNNVIVIGPSQEICTTVNGGNVLTGFTQWKYGATWDEPNMANAADIDFYVRDADTNATLASQTDRTIFQHFRLGSATFAGRRLKVCASAWHIPAGQTRTVYSTDFIHNNGSD